MRERDGCYGKKCKGWERQRERRSEKNGVRYVRALMELGGGKLHGRREKERKRESNSRYNFGAPRKLKLLRAEHAELSAVFLPGTIEGVRSFCTLTPFPDCFRYAPSLSSSFFHEGLLLLIWSKGTSQIVSRISATFGVKRLCVVHSRSAIQTLFHKSKDECKRSLNQKLNGRQISVFESFTRFFY